MKLLRIISGFFLGCLLAQPALALVGGQITGGSWLSGKWESDATTNDLKGNPIGILGYVDPFPVIPVGIGLSYRTLEGRSDDTTAQGDVFSLVLLAWTPVSFAGLTPYAGIHYALSAKIDEEKVSTGSLELTTAYTGSGLGFNAGLKYSIFPLTSVLFEYFYGSWDLKADSRKIGGSSLTAPTDVAVFNASSMALGLELRL